MDPRNLDARKLWILWAAFLVAQPVFRSSRVPAREVVVVGATSAPAATEGPVGPVLAFVAARPSLLSVAWGRLVGPAGPTAHLVRWGLAESVALLGLVVRVTGGSAMLAAFLAGAGFLLVLLQAPRGG